MSLQACQFVLCWVPRDHILVNIPWPSARPLPPGAGLNDRRQPKMLEYSCPEITLALDYADAFRGIRRTVP